MLKGYIILSILILLKYSPVDSENRKLDQEERKKSHSIIVLMQVLLLITYFLLWKYGNEKVMKVIAVANICVAIFQLISIGTNMVNGE
ncbi:accessory gene regulator B family protein [Sellimonas intestinalis]|uniref:accessory gene regulator B family protein n=1 Tax=Sellimonas intestinalis TaxID=1653434 RepID=UPI003AB84BA8